MQSKNAITIVHMIAGMLGMHKLYVCYLCVWTTDVGRALKYSMLLLVHTLTPCDSSFKAYLHVFA